MIEIGIRTKTKPASFDVFLYVCMCVCMCVRTIKPSVNRYSYSVKTPSTVVYTGHKAPPTH